MQSNNLLTDYENIQKTFLKSIIAQPEIIPAISEVINSSDFTNIKYQEIYKTCLKLFSLNKDITIAEIVSDVKERANIDINYEDYDLFDNPPLDNPLTIANLLKTKSTINKAVEISNASKEELLNSNTPLETLGKLQQSISNLSLRLSDNDTKTLEEDVNDLKLHILQDEGEEVYTIPSSYETLNNYINGGFKPSQLITVGARTGVGKTVVATQCTATACALGKSVLYFSLEMGRDELLKRLIACHGNIMLSLLRPRPDRDNRTKQKISDISDEISKWKLKIVDEPDVTLEKIRSIAQQTAQSENGLDMIIIDYLQLISTKGSYNKNRQEIVAEISRNCKMMAKELGVPVMVLVQLNRELRGDDPDRLPGKEDIRESAAIAADSDIILILHRKKKDDSTDPKAMFILDKNREGASEKHLIMRCVLEKNIFQDLKQEGSLNDEDSKDNNSEQVNKTENSPEEKNNIIEKEQPQDFGNIQDLKNWITNTDEVISDSYDIFEDM